MAWYKMTAYEFAKTAQTAELCRLFFFMSFVLSDIHHPHIICQK